MSSRKPKIRGVVREVGLERDENQFHSFNLKMGVVINAGKKLSYEEGEKVMKGFKQDFLGKTVEIIPSKAKKSRKPPSKKSKKAAKSGKKASGT